MTAHRWVTLMWHICLPQDILKVKQACYLKSTHPMKAFICIATENGIELLYCQKNKWIHSKHWLETESGNLPIQRVESTSHFLSLVVEKLFVTKSTMSTDHQHAYQPLPSHAPYSSRTATHRPLLPVSRTHTHTPLPGKEMRETWGLWVITGAIQSLVGNWGELSTLKRYEPLRMIHGPEDLRVSFLKLSKLPKNYTEGASGFPSVSCSIQWDRCLWGRFFKWSVPSGSTDSCWCLLFICKRGLGCLLFIDCLITWDLLMG